MFPVFTDLPGKESRSFWYCGVDCWLQPHQIKTTFSSDTQNTKQIKKMIGALGLSHHYLKY